jgi:hypothetical protein
MASSPKLSARPTLSAPEHPIPSPPTDAGTAADRFVVVAFLICAVVIVLLSLASFLARFWS